MITSKTTRIAVATGVLLGAILVVALWATGVIGGSDPPPRTTGDQQICTIVGAGNPATGGDTGYSDLVRMQNEVDRMWTVHEDPKSDLSPRIEVLVRTLHQAWSGPHVDGYALDQEMSEFNSLTEGIANVCMQ